MTESAGAVEYTDCFSAEGNDFPIESLGYNSRQFDGQAPVMVEIWGIRSTPLLTAPPGPPWLEVVALGRVLSLGQKELNCVLMLN